jgi:hypothetical protein
MRARNCAALALGSLLLLGACSWAAAALEFGTGEVLQSHLGPYDALARAAGGGAAGRALLRQQSKKQKEAARKKEAAAKKKKEAARKKEAAAKKKKQEKARRDAFFSTQDPVVVPALPPLAAAPALPAQPDAGAVPAPEQPPLAPDGAAPTETPVPAPVAQPWLPSAPFPGGFSGAAPTIPQAQTRDAMCTAGSRTGAVVVAGKRTGSGYYNACRFTASGEEGCCANCKANAECKGWFFTRMDCTAFGGGADVGVCYMIANPVAAWVEAGASAAGGVLARA